MSLYDSLIESAWTFTRSNGILIAPVMRFLPKGIIGGYYHPSEQCWDFCGRYLRFQTISGETTTLFDEMITDEHGLCELSGNSRIDPSVRHVLKRTIMPSLANNTQKNEVNIHIHQKTDNFSSLKFIDICHDKLQRNLVVIRAGHNSLHTQWPRNIEYEDRNWDLCISWYDKELPEIMLECEYFIHQPKDKKFSAIFNLFKYNYNLWSYDYIWFPDDDLMISWRDINRFLNIIRRQDFLLAQPSLDPDSFVNHSVTANHPDCLFRYSQFVEVMCPAFSREALKLCIPSFEKSIYGFGLDHVWPCLLGRHARRMAIIDNVCIKHTRPIGSNYNINEAVNEGVKIKSLYGTSEHYRIDGSMNGGIHNL